MRHPIGSGLEARFDHDSRVLWIFLPDSPAVLTPDLLQAFTRFYVESGLWAPCKTDVAPLYAAARYVVLTTRSPTRFTCGADLQLLLDLARRQDKSELTRYAMGCVDAFYPLIVGFGRGITTVSLVRGSVLSLGVDLALSCNLVIAEKTALFGMPELLYNGVPGIAAFSLVAKRVGISTAQRVLGSNRTFSAPELQAMGIIDAVTEERSDHACVSEFVTARNVRRDSFSALERARDLHGRVSYEELTEMARLWATTAADLAESDLQNMERYMRSQQRWTC